jgi:archaellum biogenesis ATPase FlaH
MKKPAKPDYNHDVQRLYLEMFLSNPESYIRCQNIFEPENFDQKLRGIAEFIKTYADEYKTLPAPSIVNARTNSKLETHTLGEENYEWLLNEFEQFSRHKGLERAIFASADLLNQGDYGPVERMIKEAVQISLSRDMGTDYFHDPRSRLNKLKNNNGQVSTGWPAVDSKLYGGFNRGELNIFAAASGGGKSLFLANLAVNWALMGLNVVYLTFELSEELVSLRLDSMLTGIASREIFRSIDDVELKVKMIGRTAGNIKVKYMPSGKTANDLRAYLKEYQIKNGYKADVVLIDYLDLMMPMSVKVSPSDLFVKDKYVSEELRNLAMETRALTVTASQLNRSAVEEVEFDHSHISGGLSKIQTADNVIGIFTSRAMKERGRYQIQFMKTRNSGGVGQKVDLEFNIDTLRISDLGEQESEGNIQQVSSIYQNLKRTSTVSKADPDTGEIADPTIGKPLPKIRGAQVQNGALIRQMLTNINPELDS